MKNIIWLILIVLFRVDLFAQAPQKMTYQAVIRNSSNVLITSSTVGMRISILQGSATGTAVYVETQSPMTNANGLVSVEIGSGTVVSGSFSGINWASGLYFIKTETDPTGGTAYSIAGTSQMLSVPYALHAKTASAITGGINETDPVFIASPAGGISSADITNWDNKLSTEVDGSITNEIQALSRSNDTIYLSDGGFVKLPAGFDGQYASLSGAPTVVSAFSNDAGYLTTEVDGSVTNEIQALSLSNDTVYLSNGGFVKLPAGFDGQYASLSGAPTAVSAFTNDAGYLATEVDGSVTNEIQALSLSNDTVYLSNGGFVKLPAGFDGQYASLSGAPTAVSAFTNDAGYLATEVDGSVTNEIQALSLSNDTVFLSNGGFVKLPAGFDGQYASLTGAPTVVSAFTNDAGYLATEVDGSVTNEIQALSLSNDTVFLSNGGFVKLPAGFDGQYASLTGAPTVVSAFTNDTGYLATEVDGSVTNEIQALSLSNDTVYLSNGGFVKLPASFDGQYSSLSGAPTAVSAFSNDAGYLSTEVDGSVTNEIQALSLSNDTVFLSNGGFVKLPAGSGWSLLGNSGTVDGTNFIGTTDNVPLSFKVNGQKSGRIDPNGTSSFGYQALNAGPGSFNTAVGNESQFAGSSGYWNTSLGNGSLRFNVSGGYNVAVGAFALTTVTGNRNTAIGGGAGGYAGGSGNVFIGYFAGLSEQGSNKLYIANDSSTNNPPLIYGDFSSKRVGLGTKTPAARLDIKGTLKVADGTEGTGKVLTSDANGLASWKKPAIDPFYLGQDTLGGIVYHIYKGSDGVQHGLIVSKTESSQAWQTVGSTTNATRSWDGTYNTGLMTGSPAATYVSGLSPAGWYLPSIDELSLLWMNRFHVNKACFTGGHTLLSKTGYYWSSTEESAALALAFYFNSGLAITTYRDGRENKTSSLIVRAVRAF